MTEPRPFAWQRDAPLVSELARALGHELSPARAAALGRYVELVAQWNRKLDLTGARTPVDQVEVLLADALVLCDQALVARGAHLLDVGSGAGAPALPLLLAREDLTASLVEPLRKRVAFLRTTTGRLGLAGRVRVVEGRLEPGAASSLEVEGDLALSRATFAPERWLPLALSLAASALVLLAGAAPPSPPTGARLALARDYRLPFSGAPRRVALYRRV